MFLTLQSAFSLLSYINNRIIMNKCFFVLSFLLLVSCVEKLDKGINAIKIVNNSDDEIFVFAGRESFYEDPFGKSGIISSKREYNEFLRDRLVTPHSYKYYNEWRIHFSGSSVIIGDTVFYMAVVNRLDFDTLSDEEFKSKINKVIQYEYMVTPQYMINHDWTLVYPPESDEE